MKNFEKVCKGNVKKYLTLITDNVIELLLEDETLMFTVNDYIIETIDINDMEDVVYYSEKFVSLTNCLKDISVFEDNNEIVSLEELFLINVIKDAFDLDTMIIHGISSKGFFYKAISSKKQNILEKIECLNKQLSEMSSEDVALTVVRYLDQDMDISLEDFYSALRDSDKINELRLGHNYILRLDSNLLPKEAVKNNPTRVAISKLNDLEYITPRETFTIKDFGKVDCFKIPENMQKFFDQKNVAKQNFVKTVSGEYFAAYPYFFKKESFKKEERVIFENVNKNIFETIVFHSDKLTLKKDQDVVISLTLKEIMDKKDGTDMFIKTLKDSKPAIDPNDLLLEIIKSLSK